MNDEATERAVSSSPSPESKVGSAQLGTRLQTAIKKGLDSLDDKQRSLLSLYYLEEATLEKLSAVYAVHLSTVARWLERARLQLCKAVLDALGPDAASISDDDIEIVQG